MFKKLGISYWMHVMPQLIGIDPEWTWIDQKLEGFVFVFDPISLRAKSFRKTIFLAHSFISFVQMVLLDPALGLPQARWSTPTSKWSSFELSDLSSGSFVPYGASMKGVFKTSSIIEWFADFALKCPTLGPPMLRKLFFFKWGRFLKSCSK